MKTPQDLNRLLPKLSFGIFLIVFASAVMASAQAELRYTQACSPEESLEIAAVGDVLLHSPLQIQATQSSQRFLSLWSQVRPMLARSDVTYANLEGPSAPGITVSGASMADPGFQFDNKVYTSYPQFNYHPYVIEDLQSSGVDIVSTANNHALDRYSIGVDRTIEQLEKRRMLFTGTRSSQNPNQEWFALTESKGRRIAWLACTFSTNGIADRKGQVLPCYENPKEILALVADLSKRSDIDAVIVTPHWGVEYESKPHESQVWLGRQLLEAGATAVIGTHPHVVQPWEKYVTKDGREGLIVYSTGNFVSGQDSVARRTSILVQLNLVSKRNQKLAIRGVRFLPVFMQRSDRGYEVVPVYRYDGSVPAQAVGIWKGFYSEKQRIQSEDENSAQLICKASREIPIRDQ